MSSKTWLTRRNVLRGLGVGLALPWLESLSPSPAQAQAASTPIKRYLLMYFPCGVARDYWAPTGQGAAAAWSLSALLEPLQAYKQYLQVLSNVGQEELYNAGVNPNPSHSLYCAPSFSCTVPDTKQPILNGVTSDQILAKSLNDRLLAQNAAPPPFKSLQTGCSTMNSSPDGRHPSMTRSISWAASDVPLYKEVNPQKVFDTLSMQLAPGGASDPANQALAQLRKDRKLSLLDYVASEATSLNTKLSPSDRHRLDQFLTSVQEIEGRVRVQGATMPTGAHKDYTRPTMSASYNERRPGATLTPDPAGYDRDTHAELMNDLISMAFETDLTRVITHMLDDARSEYHYNFLHQRTFTKGSQTSVLSATDGPLSTVTNGDLLGYHGLSHAGDSNNGFATVNRWFVEKFASLLGRLTLAKEADGTSVLDNTLVLFMSGMQGSSHQLTKLPVVFASGNPLFKADYHNNFASQVRLADVHLTILKNAFGVDIDQLGYSQGIVPELLA
jgi:hypothetical protein